jgi:replication-associated recombination protein RarA
MSKNEIIKRKLADEIISFIKNQENNILWIYGPAGVGKSKLAEWLSQNEKENVIIYINFEELIDFEESNMENNINFKEFVKLFVNRDKLNFVDKLIDNYIKIENNENTKKIFNESKNIIKKFFKKFQLIDYFEGEEVKKVKNIIVNFLLYIVNKKRKYLKKLFGNF